MAWWRISVTLLALAAFLLGAAGMASSHGHGTGSAHAAAAPLDDISASLVVAGTQDECVDMSWCFALHCTICAAIETSELPMGRLSAEGELDRIHDGLAVKGRSISPPTAPPKSA